MDHASIRHLLTPPEEESDFSTLPFRNFREFLVKADVAYYGRRNMRWAHYSARDHECGRPYVVVGTRFFARLAQGRPNGRRTVAVGRTIRQEVA